MSFVATIIAGPGRKLLSPAIANMAMRACGASAPAWLATDEACDLPLPEGADPRQAEASLRTALAGLPLDIVVQPAEGRRKRLLLADMDSTMIDQECIDELAAEIGLAGRVAAITARAMNGEIAFEPALRERVALLEGLPESVVAKVLSQRITLAAGARTLVATMRRDGARTVLVSGGFTAFTGPVAGQIGFDEHHANTLLVEDGRLTGRVAEPILGRSAKAQTLRAAAAALGLGLAETMAVGDGANDLDMLRLAGAGVALHARPAVAAQARMRVDHGDLTALLYLQGYARDAFAGP